MFKKTIIASVVLSMHSVGMTAESTGPLTTATFTAQAISATPIRNPNRGFANWAGSNMDSSYDGGSVTSGFNSGNSLAYCKVNLSAFRTAALTQAWLNTFENNLTDVYNRGEKCVIFPVYDDSSGGVDATASQIIAHLNQLKPVLTRNAHKIAKWKAGFIGAYGEWWGSKNGNSFGYQATTTPTSGVSPTAAVANANRISIRNALLSAIPPMIQVEFRYPDDIVAWYTAPLSSTTAFRGTGQSRIAVHVDCQLSAGNDTGTWQQNTGPLSGSQQQTYIAAHTEYVSYGGELSQSCTQPWRTSCAESMQDFSRFHLSWIKDTPDDAAGWWTAWNSGGCYNQIKNSMGYRIVYDSISHQSTVTAGNSITAQIGLRNIGWARVHYPHKVQLVLVPVTGTATPVVCSSRVDLRNLPSQATSGFTLTIPCTIPPGQTTGTYNAFLRIPDVYAASATNPNMAIRPANNGTYDTNNYRFAATTQVVIN